MREVREPGVQNPIKPLDARTAQGSSPNSTLIP